MQWLLAIWIVKTTVLNSLVGVQGTGILYPRESPTREVKSLDGIWNFRLDHFTGIKDEWYSFDLSKTGEIIPMPVPSSFNDITTQTEICEHVGPVWYDRTFYIPNHWKLSMVWLRFGGVHYSCQVWLNGHSVMKHEIGHLPFVQKVSKYLAYGSKNRITVMVNNTLSNYTIPQGYTETIKTPYGEKQRQEYSFDFFNYAGIQRSVHLYTTPVVYLDDVTINTDVRDGTTGFIEYNATIGVFGIQEPPISVYATLMDREGLRTGQSTATVLHTSSSSFAYGNFTIANAKLWWPYLMHHDPGYMYSIEFHIELSDPQNPIEDIYVHPVGVRTLTLTNTSYLINNKGIYIAGFGRHEDSAIRGKGVDLPLIVRDFNLIKWIGANAFRTSHYPYAEEIMDFADAQGIMIIDECPSVDTRIFSDLLLTHHQKSLEELIQRDKNRPSVIMWSIANEPKSRDEGADVYFRNVAEFVKKTDPTRPVTAALNTKFDEDKLAQYLDIIGLNRYIGWYSQPGNLYEIKPGTINEVHDWHNKYGKLIYMTEYGAGSIGGLNSLPSHMWTPRYQAELIAEHFKAFDVLRHSSFFIGEMIWNFADFETNQGYTRVNGNKKGLFTRDRQPKEAAYVVRARYHQLAAEMNNVIVPEDLDIYTFSTYYSTIDKRAEL